MARPGLRNAVVLSTFAALIALILRSRRSAPLPSSTATGGSATSTTMAPAPPTPPPVPVADTLPGIGGVDPLIAEGEPEVAAAASADRSDWIAAIGDDPPATHLVKAKLASGIYHVPGGLSYDRTKPDRWYRSAQAAEADGLRAAKR